MIGTFCVHNEDVFKKVCKGYLGTSFCVFNLIKEIYGIKSSHMLVSVQVMTDRTQADK